MTLVNNMARSTANLEEKKNWIAGALGKPGQLHKDLGIPLGEKIPQGRLRNAARQSGVVGQRARLAITLEGFHHPKKGK